MGLLLLRLKTAYTIDQARITFYNCRLFAQRLWCLRSGQGGQSAQSGCIAVWATPSRCSTGIGFCRCQGRSFRVVGRVGLSAAQSVFRGAIESGDAGGSCQSGQFFHGRIGQSRCYSRNSDRRTAMVCRCALDHDACWIVCGAPGKFVRVLGKDLRRK